MQRILSSWFVQGMVKATSDMWLKGWDERNGGNVSLRLDAPTWSRTAIRFTRSRAAWS